MHIITIVLPRKKVKTHLVTLVDKKSTAFVGLKSPQYSTDRKNISMTQFAAAQIEKPAS